MWSVEVECGNFNRKKLEMIFRMKRLGDIIVERIDEEYVARMYGTVATNNHSTVERGNVLTAHCDNSLVVGTDVGEKCTTRQVGTVTTNHHSPAMERGTVLTANHSLVGKAAGEKCSTRVNLNGGDSHNLRNILAGTVQTNNNFVERMQYEGEFGSDLLDAIDKWPDEIVVQQDGKEMSPDGIVVQMMPEDSVRQLGPDRIVVELNKDKVQQDDIVMDGAGKYKQNEQPGLEKQDGIVRQFGPDGIVVEMSQDRVQQDENGFEGAGNYEQNEQPCLEKPDRIVRQQGGIVVELLLEEIVMRVVHDGTVRWLM